MKGISYAFLRAISAFILGLLLVMFPDQVGNYLVITVGIVFMLPSLISLISYFARESEVRSRFPIEGMGSLLFGLCLVIMPGFFADFVTFVLGFMLALGGIQQLSSLVAVRRWMPVHAVFYVVPVLILIAGLVALFNPMEARATAFLLIGITGLVYAVSELFNWFRFSRHRLNMQKTLQKENSDIEEVEVIDEAR